MITFGTFALASHGLGTVQSQRSPCKGALDGSARRPAGRQPHAAGLGGHRGSRAGSRPTAAYHRAVPLLRRLLPLGLGIALLASGCASTNTAAQVGDETITIAQIQGEVVDFAGSLEEPLPVSGDLSAYQQELLTREINHLLVVELAARNDVVVTEAEVDELLDELDTQAEAQGGLEALRAQFGYTEDGLRQAALDELLLRGLQEAVDDVPQELGQLSAELGVEVNPRFGVWNGSAVLPATGSISVPASPTG